MKKILVLAAVAIFPAVQPANAEIIVGPRISYYFDNSNVRTSDIAGVDNLMLDPALNDALEQNLQTEISYTGEENVAIRGSQLTLPMFGAAVSVGDDRDRFTLTAMYGSGKGNTVETLISTRRLSYEDELISDFQVIEIDSPLFIDRYDIELTWQRRVNEKLAIFGGVRYERLDGTSPTTVTADISYNIDNFVSDTLGDGTSTPDLFQISDFEVDTTLETFSARIGVTAFVPVDQSITAFFNGMVHGSHQPTNMIRQRLAGSEEPSTEFDGSSETSIGPDIAVGMQLHVAENISLDLRYRAIFFFPVSGGLSFNDARVNHGVNMGLSFRL